MAFAYILFAFFTIETLQLNRCALSNFSPDNPSTSLVFHSVVKKYTLHVCRLLGCEIAMLKGHGVILFVKSFVPPRSAKPCHHIKTCLNFSPPKNTILFQIILTLPFCAMEASLLWIVASANLIVKNLKK